jgi:4-amino-4-deoxychorismate lyase
MFVETIKVFDNKILNIDSHNKRLNLTIKDNFFKNSDIDLRNFIDVSHNKKVRVVYSNKIENIEYSNIEQREFKKFKLIHDNNINYKYKSTNRESFNKYIDKTQFDDIIIIKDGFLTDTSIANIYFYKDDKWFTPITPLLFGTKREELINKMNIKQINIDLNFVQNSEKMAISNAIIGFYICEDYEII